MRHIPITLLLCLMLGLSGCASLFSADDPPRKRPKHRVVTAPAPVKTTRSVATPRPTIFGREGEYTVKPGDTLYSIAFRNQMDFRELATLNGIGADYRISVGQRLKLRGSVVPQEVEPPASRPVITESTTAKFDWLWPTTGRIERGYALQSGFKGVDFTGNLGQPVFAAAPGRVVYSGNALKGYGELIIIKHSDVFLSAYGYNRKRHVVEGDVVTAGQPIGELGLGPESKPLLHFEIREHGQPIDPAEYLPKRETVPGVTAKN
jgi:lipoprotein NlpD